MAVALMKALRHLRRGWLAGTEGQATSEYVTLLGFMAATVIACMATFISPVALAAVRMFKRLVVYLSS